MIDVVRTWFAPYPFVGGPEDIYLGGLIHSPAEVIRQLLIDYGVGTLPSTNQNWPVYATAEAATLDRTITVLDTTGIEDGRLMPTGEAPVHHGIQVIVRSRDHQEGYRRATRIRETFARQVNNDVVVVEDTTYRVPCMTKIGAILPLGKDVPVSGRSRFSLNCTSPVKRLEA
jgi:hypothetical protein